jgi:hypothetical protein
MPDLSKQGIDQQPAAHPDPPVDAPHGEGDPALLQGFTPGEDVLVHAVHQGAVEIEEEGRRGIARGVGHVGVYPGDARLRRRASMRIYT